jgi:hypothetical protein
MRQDREPLPTAEQIKAIDDVGALEGMREELERRIVRMRTDLEFRVDDDDWAPRARAALSLHSYAARRIDRRLAALRSKAPKGAKAKRPEGECNPLTLEALAKPPAIVVSALTTTQEIDDHLATLAAQVNAVEVDRTDEISLRAGERDEAFLAATGGVLATMRLLRQQLQVRRGEISRAERKRMLVEEAASRNTREQLFIDAAREILDRATYVAIWDRVDQIEARSAAA